MFPFIPTSGINPVAEFYIPLVWRDKLLFHVSLLLSAHRLERLDPTIPERRTIRLARECMRMLKERVSGPLENGISDETLSAVAGLAAIEVRPEWCGFFGAWLTYSSMKRASFDFCMFT